MYPNSSSFSTCFSPHPQYFLLSYKTFCRCLILPLFVEPLSLGHNENNLFNFRHIPAYSVGPLYSFPFLCWCKLLSWVKWNQLRRINATQRVPRKYFVPIAERDRTKVVAGVGVGEVPSIKTIRLVWSLPIVWDWL